MSEVAVADGGRVALRGRLGTETQPTAARLDARRALQLGLAAIWLLDGVLQYQSFMYSKAFAQMLKMRVRGLLAFTVRRAYYLMQMPAWYRRLSIIIDWTRAHVIRPDIVKVSFDSEPESLLRDAAVGYEPTHAHADGDSKLETVAR